MQMAVLFCRCLYHSQNLLLVSRSHLFVLVFATYFGIVSIFAYIITIYFSVQSIFVAYTIAVKNNVKV